MQKLIITNAGQVIIAKLVAGTADINFTKVKTSDYEYEASDIPTLTDLYQVKQTANVSSVSIVSSTIVKVRAIINNTGLTTGYYVKAVGLYATDSSTSEEILFGVSLCSDVADYIPAQSDTVTGVTYTFNCKVDDTEHVNVTVNPAGVTPMEDFEELENTVSTHTDSNINTENGVHGIRYYNDKLQYYYNGNWDNIQTGSNIIVHVTTEPGAIIVANNNNIQITKVISKGAEYIIIPSYGSWTFTAYDGEEKINSTELEINLTQIYNIELHKIEEQYKTYGFTINLNDSNPETAVEYTDDAIGMEGGSEEWENESIFKYIRPCLLKNGIVQGYLDKNDFTKFVDGTPADITSGYAGDVMIEFPRMGIKSTYSSQIQSFQITNNPSASGFSYNAFLHDKNTKNTLYIDAYLRSEVNGKLRSLSNKSIYKYSSDDTPLNGLANFDSFSINQLGLLKILFILRYKSLNSKAHIGKGYIGNLSIDGGKYNIANISTGNTNQKGMYYGTSSTFEQIKFAGIEDIYGNAPIKLKYPTSYSYINYGSYHTYRLEPVGSDNEYIGGLYYASSGSSTSNNYSAYGSYYLKYTVQSNSYGYLFLPQGKNTEEQLHEGTISTYFCDPVNINHFENNFKISYGMQTCTDPENPSGDNIIDENVGLFSMDLTTKGHGINNIDSGVRMVYFKNLN